MHSLVWFRGKDLRLSDHEPLSDAVKAGAVTLLFVLDPYFFSKRRAPRLPHRMQFLLQGLEALQKNIEAKGARLLVVPGKSTEMVPELARQLKVDRVVAHRWTEPFAQERDRRVADSLDVPFELFEGETLLPPGAVLNQQGSPYGVFTPFSRAMRTTLALAKPLAAPRQIPASPCSASLWKKWNAPLPTLKDLGLKENAQLLSGGEAAARKRLKDFLKSAVGEYKTERDRMDRDGTSRLSADLKFGTLSVRSAYHAALQAEPSEGRDTFLTQLLWREFAYSTLWHRPHLLQRPFQDKFVHFPFENDDAHWLAWVEGRTGIPIVDASARQLLQDGYVHNRARMISASFLTKNLLVDYRLGEAHYLKFLTDGDWALNNMGWQWAAGVGVDAAPYFRVFNPVTQGKKFDPDGSYVRRYVPELRELETRFIHEPWNAKPGVLSQAGVRLGEDYPLPIVDLKESRARYLELAKALKA